MRNAYVSHNADGARRSAQIDLWETDTLPPEEDIDRCPLSAQRRVILSSRCLPSVAVNDGRLGVST